MAMSEELKYQDATALAALVRKKEITPLELLEDAISRLEKLNPVLNAVVTPMYDLAAYACRSALPDGPFTGVPFLLKDVLTAYAGARMTLGARAFQNFIPDHDSELVSRYKKAGLIVIGKTNLPEFGILPTTEPEFYGPTRNPWNTAYSAGGSSGGSAAAVAARMVPMAHGSDGGGSIRIPASCCGVFGLKPTRARITMAPDVGDLVSGLISEHALTISVRDSAALLDATAGSLPGDPYWAPPVERPFVREADTDPGRLRIAFTAELPGGVAVHPDCIRAAQDAAKLCASLGHTVEEAFPRIDRDAVSRAFGVMWCASIASLVRMLRLKKEQVEPLTWGLCELSKANDAADYLIAQQTLQRAARSVAAFFEKYDAWLMPTLAKPPLPLGSFDAQPDNPVAGFIEAGTYAVFTPLANATGQPAMSVPLFWNGDGLPVGVHFVGRFGDEATLFRLAAQLEKARPWKNRLPPVCA
ncbi:MAG: amidase [Deltaproteobacteria bacterium]|nr:amidase [Deltaproteobacteria bacterium]